MFILPKLAFIFVRYSATNNDLLSNSLIFQGNVFMPVVEEKVLAVSLHRFLLKPHDYSVSVGRVMRTPEIRSSEERDEEE
jgi:hypothetical protein